MKGTPRQKPPEMQEWKKIKRPDPDMLGTGMANKAGKDLEKMRKRNEEALKY